MTDFPCHSIGTIVSRTDWVSSPSRTHETMDSQTTIQKTEQRKYHSGLAFIKCSRSGKKTTYGTFSYPSLRTHEGVASVHARRRVGPLDILPEAKLGQSLEGQLGICKVPVLHRLGVENGSRKIGSRRNHILQIRIVHGRILEGSPANVGSRKVRSDQVRLVESTALQVASCKIGHFGKD
jgi:hypothetical protein